MNSFMASMADTRRYALGNQLGEGFVVVFFLEIVLVWFFLLIFIYFNEKMLTEDLKLNCVCFSYFLTFLFSS